jgi:hypothetical protein
MIGTTSHWDFIKQNPTANLDPLERNARVSNGENVTEWKRHIDGSWSKKNK